MIITDNIKPTRGTLSTYSLVVFVADSDVERFESEMAEFATQESAFLGFFVGNNNNVLEALCYKAYITKYNVINSKEGDEAGFYIYKPAFIESKEVHYKLHPINKSGQDIEIIKTLEEYNKEMRSVHYLWF